MPAWAGRQDIGTGLRCGGIRSDLNPWLPFGDQWTLPGPETDRVAWKRGWRGRWGDRLGPSGSVQVRKYPVPIRSGGLTPPTDSPRGALRVGGADGRCGRTGEGNEQTDDRGAGVGEMSGEGVQGPVQVPKHPYRSDYWAISSWELSVRC
jgi:hypothetical protein